MPGLAWVANPVLAQLQALNSLGLTTPSAVQKNRAAVIYR